MFTQLKNLFTEYKNNGTIRGLYQSLNQPDPSVFNMHLAKLSGSSILKDSLPNLLCYLCDTVKSPEFLIPILELGIHPDTQNDCGQFPLHLAIENGNEEFVKILLRFGANPNVADKNGVTPLHISYSYDSLGAIAELLIANGADLNLRDNLGKRYLM